MHPVLPASALAGDQPRRVTIDGEHFALFRGPGGRPAALVDACPHRFAPLSAGRVRPDGRLACGYHGWHFDEHGHGVSPSQPALKRCDVGALRVVERFGYLWLAGVNASIDAIPDVRPADEGYDFAGTFQLELPCSLEHAVDVFGDAEHPAWIHGRLAWDESQLATIRYEHRRYADRSEVETSGHQRVSLLSRLLGLRPGDRFHNHWVTRFDPVRTTFHMFWTDEATGKRRPLELRISLFLVPKSDTTTSLHAFVHTKLTHPLAALVRPLLRPIAVYAGRHEAMEDMRFLANMSDAPRDLRGMRLGWLDGAIVHNRRLLERVYLKTPVVSESDEEASGIVPSPSSRRLLPIAPPTAVG